MEINKCVYSIRRIISDYIAVEKISQNREDYMNLSVH